MSLSRVICRVDLQVLKENFAQLQKHAKSCSLMPVLKYDAYGLGAVKIGSALKSAGAVRIAAATLDEALILQKIGLPIQILGLLPEWEIPDAVASGVILPVDSVTAAQKISAEAVKQQKQVKIAVKLDTGMGRLGLQIPNALTDIEKILDLPGLVPDSLFSHFATAAQPDLFFASLQLDNFRKIWNALQEKNICFPYRHHAAGDAILKLPEATDAPFNLARPGGMLYGEDFSSTCKQVIELRTFIGEIREIPQGGSVGYYRLFIANKPRKAAVLLAGYADGIPLALSNRGHVIIRGHYCPIIGRISMDYTVVDISDVPDAAIGDEVVLLGKRNDLEITVNQWGQLKGTHGHDIWCSIGHRVKREYYGGDR